jgi:tetratricopeptide (TPR) repeat protein
MNNIFRVPCAVLFLFLVLSSTGCAGKVPNSLSESQMQAISHNQRGIKYAARGDNLQAVVEFSEALKISRSIENSEGIVVALVNSSRVHRHAGDAKAALAAISGAIPYTQPLALLYAEVAFEMAQVKLLAGDLNEASEWASKAVAADNSSTRGMMINLLARIHFLKGNIAEAELKAQEALLINRNNGVRAEEANSLRTLGDIKAIAADRSVEAAAYYNQALVIDKVLGKSGKIVADLRALARLAQSQNDSGRALEFYSRAFTASRADGDLSGASEDLMNMSLIHEKRGEMELSRRLLTERDNILKNIRTPQ